jgi:filamentous hemagglutinin family protein
MTLALGLMMQAASAHASPAGGDVVAGQASISGDASGNVTVTQTTDRAVINWDSFSVAKNETVVFRQPGTQSVIANRVIGADPSSILGSIQANGRVILINRNGVVFGKDSNVDAAGLVVSTHDLDQSAFMAGSSNIRFNDGGVDTAEIVVNGRISIRDAGLAAFVAPHVRNDGLIEAKLGRVALGAGRGFSVDLFGDGLISFAAGDEVTRSFYGADGNAVNALVENSGTIIANGGQILLTASAARDIINASVNVAGVVRADSASNRNGIITLSGSGAVLTDTNSLMSASGAQGGNINVQGSAVALGGIVDASSSGRRNTGGSVNVQAQGLLSLGGTVKANATQGAGGNVIYRAGRVMENSSGVTDVRGLSDGGTISAIAARDYATSGTYLADGLFGKGGRIDVTGGGTVSLLSANLFASGRNMGGLVRAGGPFQGGKAFDGTSAIYDTFVARWNDAPALPHAANLFVSDSTRIDVSASRGAGGTAILWSDKTTTFLGAIDARGWTPGSVEVSSADNLRYVSLDTINTGPGGTILLDPKNIIIGSTNDVSAWSYAGVLSFVGGVTALPKNENVLSTSDQFGNAVALNAAGDRLAVGAAQDDGLGDASNNIVNAGAVYLFSFSDTNFSGGVLEAVIGRGYSGGKNVNLTQLERDDLFGWSVSLNAAGNRLAVGAYADDGSGNPRSSSGAVYLFSFSDTNFSGGLHEATIGFGYTTGANPKNVDMTSLLATSDFFGTSVSLNAAGDRLAVGAPGDDGFNNPSGLADSGAVYLFRFSDTNFSSGVLDSTIGRNYSGSKNFNLSALAASDRFGAYVSLISLDGEGNRLAVGATGDDGFNNPSGLADSGAVYLFSFSDTNFSAPALEATIGSGYTGGKNVDITRLETLDQFGSAVSLNAAGNLLAVGAGVDGGLGNIAGGSGAAYLFSFSGARFSGGVHEATIGRGYSGGKNVNLTQLDNGDTFGRSVSLNGAGNRLAVGAHKDSGSGNARSQSGAVYLFSFSDTAFSGGTLQSTVGYNYAGGKNVSLFGLDSSDQFGRALSLNAAGDRLAVGTPGDDGFGDALLNSGAVYLFSFSDSSFNGGALQSTIGYGYSSVNDVNLTLLDPSDNFGLAVSLNAAGDRLAVGANGDDGFGNALNDSGAVYLFSFSDSNFSGGALQSTIGYGYSSVNDVNLTLLDPSDQLGTAVSLNAAGDRLAVSANGDDGFSNSVSNRGKVYLFTGPVSAPNNFAANPSGTVNISAASLAASLRSGSNVLLQANNDITVNNPIVVTGSTGGVGALNLNAGRSILINANITTQSGNVVLTGNGTTASGVLDAQRDAGAAVITMAPGTAIDAGTGTISILLDTGAGLTNNTSGDISLQNLTGSKITVRNAGPSTGSGILLNNGAQLIASGSGNAITLVGQKFVNNAGASALSASNGFWRIWSANPANDTVGGLAFDYKQYGLGYSELAAPAGTGNGLLYSFAPTLTATLGASSKTYDTHSVATPESLAFDGLLSGDILTLPTYASALYDTRDAGTNKTVTATGLGATITSGGKPVYGYIFPSSVSHTNSVITPASLAISGVTANITSSSLVITGVTAQNKVYDATLNATLTGGSVTGLGSDAVSLITSGATGSFADKNVGNGKAVTASGYALTGGDAGNYTLEEPMGLTANITPASLVIAGVTAQNKVYDTTLSATLTGGTLTGLGSDVVNLVTTNATGSFADKNVGIGKAVTASGYTITGGDAGNYTLVPPTGLTANITPVTHNVWHYLDRNKPERGCNQSNQQSERALNCGVPWGDWLQVKNSETHASGF